MTDIIEVIHAWIREDAPAAAKMTLHPEHVQKLVERLSAVSPGVLPGEVCDRLINAMLYHTEYEGAAASIVRPSDLNMALRAITGRVDLLEKKPDETT